MVLKLRNLIVLTMRTAGTSTRASPGMASPCAESPVGYANTVAAITPAAAGLGIPTK
jgi:hypothetical protein